MDIEWLSAMIEEGGSICGVSMGLKRKELISFRDERKSD